VPAVLDWDWLSGDEQKESSSYARINVLRSGSSRGETRVTFVKTTLVVGGRDFVGTGASHVDETDIFDRDTGELLAVGRALQDLSRQLRRAGWNRVHR